MYQKNHSYRSSTRKFPVLSLLLSLGAGILVATILFKVITHSNKSDKTVQEGVQVGEAESSPFFLSNSFVLYRNCKNRLTIPRESFTLSGTTNGRFIPKKYEASVEKNNPYTWLIPTGDQCKLIFSPTNTHENIELSLPVVDPPKPSLKVHANGVLLGESINYLNSKFSVKIVPDPTFLTQYPTDALYEIEKLEIWIRKPGQQESLAQNVPLDALGQKTNQEVSFELDMNLRNLPLFTYISFKFAPIIRKNFEGKEIIDHRFSEHERTFSFFVK